MQSLFYLLTGPKTFNHVYINELSASLLNFSTFANNSFWDYVSEAAHLSQRIVNKNFKYLMGKRNINIFLFNSKNIHKKFTYWYFNN